MLCKFVKRRKKKPHSLEEKICPVLKMINQMYLAQYKHLSWHDLKSISIPQN